MPELVAYAVQSTTTNGVTGTLVKAQCYFCGRKYGSIDEAKECERKHIQDEIYKKVRVDNG